MRQGGEAPGKSGVAPGLALIVNARARRVRRHYLPYDPFWQRHLPEAAVVVTETPADLVSAIVQMRTERPAVIACLGGDGSLQHLVTAVLGLWGPEDLPAFLPLSGGTMNGLAQALGTGGRPEGVLAAALAGIAAGRQPLRPLALIELREPAAQSTRFGFTFAAGLAARAVARYDRTRTGGWRGVLAVWAAALRAAIRDGGLLAPVELTVEIAGERLPGATSSFVASVVDRPFRGFRPFGTTPAPPSAFRFLAIAMPPRAALFRFWRIFRGNCHHPGILIGNSNSAWLQGAEGYVLDGERFSVEGQLAVELRSGPNVAILDFAGTARDPGAKAGYSSPCPP